MAGTETITGQTRLIALLGKPTGHSLSPVLHNASFRLLGIDAVYLCFDVEAADLGPVIATMRSLDGWDGANVTMPCKQAVAEFLDELDETAALVGAVNVIKKQGAKLKGFNTDGRGFIADLKRHGIAVSGCTMVLLGPGGAGSSIMAQAALDGAACIDVFARAGGKSYRHAESLAPAVSDKTGCRICLHDASAVDELAYCIAQADILVNATPVGMGNAWDDSPVAASLLKPGLIVADAVYHPVETRLIADARAHDCTALPGTGMLVGQAAASQEIWFGAHVPIDEMESMLKASIPIS